EDLLGRDPVTPDDTLLHANIRDKVVMVTGAGGSIGSELCRQIVRLQPECLVLFEQSEFGLYQIERELDALARSSGLKVRILAMLGSVVDKKLLESCVRNLKVQTIYHAAAYKHVPLVEYNVVAGIRNNVFGTLHVAEVADRCGVETCVLISTDKAVRPTNVMGASKRLSELVLQGMQKRQTKTRFSMVRFGNVLGSSGSVIPLFREQIANGGPVTVTHPEIIRYFMTIPEAAQLVIQAGAMAKGGDVFVLDMGEPVRIDDLARKMILLMGYQVKDASGDGDIEIVYSGLRPGEKLYEELLIGDNVTATAHPRVMRATEFALDWAALNNILRDLERLCAQEDCAGVREFLQDIPIEFNPQGELEDLVWKHRDPCSELEEPAPLAEVVSFKKRKELVN
ncbi:MAG: polysaccharide biosynthesis protein, partial [Gammaproteobacteria bacterium]|nr:polysaccharide biosynthesis protein [Gammaproteobacteria bacterium]